MKKLYWLFLLFPLSLFSQGHFYYYKGEKQYLQLDTNYVFVSTINGNALQKDKSLLNTNLVLNREQISNTPRWRGFVNRVLLEKQKNNPFYVFFNNTHVAFCPKNVSI